MNAKLDDHLELLDCNHLRTFLAVAQDLSFTRAAARLDLGQSTVSQHVRNLEARLGRPLLARDTHTVQLTAEGEALTSVAQSILDLNENAMRLFSESPPSGRIRFGFSEDLALSHLPAILREFRTDHPHVDLELTLDVSGVLQRKLTARKLDLVLAKRLHGQAGGSLVRREQMVWAAAPGFRLAAGQPVPLILYPEPSVSRAAALAALEDRGRPHRTVCTANSLSGLRAAALAGLGVVVYAAGLLPPDLAPLPAESELPRLPWAEFALVSRRRHPSGPERALGRTILASALGQGAALM